MKNEKVDLTQEEFEDKLDEVERQSRKKAYQHAARRIRDTAAKEFITRNENVAVYLRDIIAPMLENLE